MAKSFIQVATGKKYLHLSGMVDKIKHCKVMHKLSSKMKSKNETMAQSLSLYLKFNYPNKVHETSLAGFTSNLKAWHV